MNSIKIEIFRMSVCPICYENETQLETNCGHRLRFYRSNRMYKEGCVFPMLVSSELSMGKTYPTLLGLVASFSF